MMGFSPQSEKWCLSTMGAIVHGHSFHGNTAAIARNPNRRNMPIGNCLHCGCQWFIVPEGTVIEVAFS